MSNYLVDTHPLIWLKTKKEKNLSRKVKSIFKGLDNGKNTIFVSAPVVWELGYQYRKGKFKIPNYIFFKDWVREELFKHPNIQFVETVLEETLYATDFRVNNDPFDNLIVATAIRMDLPLISKDESIRLSGACEVVW